MKVTDFPPLELEIPVGLMPLLLVRAEQPLQEIQKVLGVSDQVFHEFCNGRGRLSPMKAGRMAALARLSPRELTWVAEAARTWKTEERPKEGTSLTHPFRGAAKLRRIDQGTADLILMPKDRPMNGVPLLVFEADFIGKKLLDMPPTFTPEDVPKSSHSEIQGLRDMDRKPKALDTDVVTQGAVDALFARSGLSHAALANLIGISPSVISAHADGRAAMPRARYQRLEAAVASITRKTAVKSSPIKKKEPKVAEPQSAQQENAPGFVARETVAKTIRGSGLTLRQIAALLGISDSMVGHYMTGRNKMSEKRHEELQTALKNRHVQPDMARKLTATPVPPKADQSSIFTPEADLLKNKPEVLPAPPASIFVTGLTAEPIKPPRATPLDRSDKPLEKAAVAAAPAAPKPLKSPAEAMLEMLDLVQGSLAELFGGRELLAQRMALLDQLPTVHAKPAVDPEALADILAAQATLDRRLAGVEIQITAARAEIGGVVEMLQRLDSRISATPAPAGCSVTRLARLLAAD